MKLVRQECVGDCGPACVATVLGCSLSAARSLLYAEPGKGITDEQIVTALVDRGVPALASTVWPGYSVSAILSVPSLNHRGLMHYIVWDGEEYLDPTHEGYRYPDDSPVVHGVRLEPQWSTVVLLLPSNEAQLVRLLREATSMRMGNTNTARMSAWYDEAVAVVGTNDRPRNGKGVL